MTLSKSPPFLEPQFPICKCKYSYLLHRFADGLSRDNEQKSLSTVHGNIISATNAKFKKLTFKSGKQKPSIVHVNSYLYNTKQLFLKTTFLKLILLWGVDQIWNRADGLYALNHFPMSLGPSYSSLSSPELWAALSPSLWNNHLQYMECWHGSNTAPHSAISLDHGNVLALWEWGKLRGPDGGQPVQKWQPWARINESH